MKQKKILIISAVSILLVIIGIIAAMFATGKFDTLLNKETTTSESTEENEQTTITTVVKLREKTPKPASPVAVIYNEFSEKTGADILSMQEIGFNTVIFELEKDNVQWVMSAVKKANEQKLYCGVISDVSESPDTVYEFIEKCNVDFVILDGCDETVGTYDDDVKKIGKEIKDIDSVIEIGIVPMFTSIASKRAEELVTSMACDFVFVKQKSGSDTDIRALEVGISKWSERTSTIWVCHNLEKLSSFSGEKATKTVELIKKAADIPLCSGISFYPFSDIASASGSSADIVKKYIKERDTFLIDKDFSISNYKTTSITVEQPTITFKGTSSPAYELKCNGQKLSVAPTGDFSCDCKLNPGENTIKFEHKGKTYTYNVTYKIKLIKSVSPTDSMSVPGEMVIEVSATALKGATLSVSFNGKSYAMKESASLSGDEDLSPDKASDFVNYTASVPTPESRSSVQNLGQIKVTAKYQGLTESMNGSKVSVTAKEPETVPPTTAKPTTTAAPTTKPTTTNPTTQAPVSVSDVPNTSDASETSTTEKTDVTDPITTTTEKPTSSTPPSNTLQKYSPSENYGLGTADICEIIESYAEVYPGNTTSTVSIPDCSPLLKGTCDYITGTATFDGAKYYILKSGIKVPEFSEERLASGSNGRVYHAKRISGYVMPSNSINVLSCRTTSSDTVIVLEMNRCVPFNAKLTGQTYGAYGNRMVSVSHLDCKGLEFVFSDTVTATGSFSFMNSVCKSASWSTDSSSKTATLKIELATTGKFYGFHYELDNNDNLVIKIKNKPSSSLKGYTIMLDPGHGGIDSGAVCAVSSSSFGLEKQIDLSIALKVKELLEAEGAKVIMTRDSDRWVCYVDRNEAVRDKNPDMFIAIHCDSSNAASAYGTSAYYYRAYSQPLAKALHESIVNAYKTNIYSGKSESFKKSVSRGANFYAFRVIRVEECPAVLIEYGFVSNIDECQTLQNAKNREILAQATVDGIKNYIANS